MHIYKLFGAIDHLPTSHNWLKPRTMGYGQIIIIPKPEFGGFERVFPFLIKIILPKANIAPEKSTPGRGDSYWNPSFSGAFEILLFVSGRGQITHLWGFFPTGPGFFGSLRAQQIASHHSSCGSGSQDPAIMADTSAGLTFKRLVLLTEQQRRQNIWVFPKIGVPPNHPF